MAAGAAVPGLFFVFAAMVLLIFVSFNISYDASQCAELTALPQASVSAPTWNSVSFLNSEGIHFGVFGYTGSQTHVGWYFPSPIAYVQIHRSSSRIPLTLFSSVSDDRLNDGLFHNLTQALILIPIGMSIQSLLPALSPPLYPRA